MDNLTSQDILVQGLSVFEPENASFLHHLELFRALFHVLDSKGEVVFASSSLLKLLEYERTEYVTHNITEFETGDFIILPSDVDPTLATPSHVRKLKTKSGEIVELAVSPQRLEDEGKGYVVCLLTDITPLREAERGIAEKDRQFELALNAGKIGTWEYDVEAQTVYWSDILQEIHGLVPGTFDGTYEAYTRDLHPDDKEMVLQGNRESLLHRDDHQVEYRIVWPDGSIHWISGTGKVIRDENGRAIKMIGVSSDVTDRVLVNQAMAVKSEAEASLREADRRKDQFLATLAHELRNPLAPMTYSVDLLRMPNAPDELRSKSLDTLSRQLQHMVRLVDDLLDVSRISQDKLELRHEPCSLQGIIYEAIETSNPGILAKAHKLSVQMPDEQILVIADSHRLRQVFSNILNNASKFTDFEGRIDLVVSQKDGLAEVSITDSGIGMDADHIESIFDLFTQIGRGVDRVQDGLGIGLSLAKRIVEMHSGSMVATSPGPDKGTTIRVFIPSGTDSFSTPAEVENCPSFGLKSKLGILVVDDNVDSANGLANLLTNLGHHVKVSFEPRGALDICRNSVFDLAFLDVGMPGMSGYDLARRIRLLPAGRETRLVAVTGWGQEKDREQALESGFDRHIVKPMTSDTLRQVISELSSKARKISN